MSLLLSRSLFLPDYCYVSFEAHTLSHVPWGMLGSSINSQSQVYKIQNSRLYGGYKTYSAAHTDTHTHTQSLTPQESQKTRCQPKRLIDSLLSNFLIKTFLGMFQVHSKTEGKVQKSPTILLPPDIRDFPIINTPHQSGTSFTTDEPSLTHNHPKSIL